MSKQSILNLMLLPHKRAYEVRATCTILILVSMFGFFLLIHFYLCPLDDWL